MWTATSVVDDVVVVVVCPTEGLVSEPIIPRQNGSRRRLLSESGFEPATSILRAVALPLGQTVASGNILGL